jgi:hypothetical protein
MNTEQTEKKTRTPRNFDSILSGAQKLTLKERVDLVSALTAQNKAEAAAKLAEAQEAEKLVG